MRRLSLFSVLVASVSLAGCAGGSGSSSALLLASDLSICGLSCTPSSTDSNSNTDNNTDTGGTTGVDTSGGSPGADNGNGGNTTNLANGTALIALEAGKVASGKSTSSLGRLTLTAGSPNTAKIEIDTNTANNALWAVPKTMDEYLFGSDKNNPASSSFVGYALGAAGDSSTTGGVSYNEYRAYQDSTDGKYDEVLQVWTFGDSYAAQYRDETSGSEVADKQAWTFGGMNAGLTPGTKASGSAIYNGRFGSTSITRNWIN